MKHLDAELCYILAYFSMCVDFWKVLSMVCVCINVGKKSLLKNCYAVSDLSVVSRIFEKNWHHNHRENCFLFS